MNDRQREILSAMMDDQADERSVQSILNEGAQEAIRDQWYRWHLVRDLLRAVDTGPERGGHRVDVMQAVSAALDSESLYGAGSPRESAAGDVLGGQVGKND